MLCQMCKCREATEKRTLGVRSGSIEAYLCDDCAKRAQSGNVFNEKYRNNFWKTEEMELRCEVCKTKLSDFLETGYVGCERCYQTFEHEIERRVLEINGKNIYVGKIPEKLQSRISRSSELKQLTSKLESCLASGDHAEAKRLRAQILKIGGVHR